MAEPVPSPQAQALLAELRDIHLPAPNGWGEAVLAVPGTWLAAAAICIALGAVLAWRHWQTHRDLRDALRTLRALQRQFAHDGDSLALGRDLSGLLRRHALRCFPALPVAGLTGDDWLAFLDAHGGGTDFRQGPGAALASLPYRATPAGVEGGVLLALAERWLRANLRQAPSRER